MDYWRRSAGVLRMLSSTVSLGNRAELLLCRCAYLS